MSCKITAFGVALSMAGVVMADGRDLQHLDVLYDNGPVVYEGIRLDGDLVDPAAIVWDNGGDNYVSGNELTNFLEANDFVLSQQVSIEHVDFSAFDLNNTVFANWDGAIQWEVRMDAGGVPGGVVASGLGTNINFQFDQTNGNGWDFYQWSMDLDDPPCVDPGTYWFTLHMNTSCTVRQDYYWGQANPNGTMVRHYDQSCDGSWSPSATNESAFVLSGQFGCADCLTMQVSQHTAGQNSIWRVDGATPGEQVAIVWGTNPGSTVINGFAGYCASFGIQGVNQNRVVCRKNADGAGVVSCNKLIPTGAQGLRVLTQAAERNTCPDECMSNLDDQVVQ